MISKVEIKDIPGRRTRAFNVAVTQDVLDFFNSDWLACEVNTGLYKSVKAATSAYREAIEKAKVGVTAIQLGDKLYLVKEGVK